MTEWYRQCSHTPPCVWPLPTATNGTGATLGSRACWAQRRRPAAHAPARGPPGRGSARPLRLTPALTLAIVGGRALTVPAGLVSALGEGWARCLGGAWACVSVGSPSDGSRRAQSGRVDARPAILVCRERGWLRPRYTVQYGLG